MKKFNCIFLVVFFLLNLCFSINTNAQEPVRYLNEIFQDNQINIRKDIVYKKVKIDDDKEIELKLDLYLPQTDELEKITKLTQEIYTNKIGYEPSFYSVLPEDGVSII